MRNTVLTRFKFLSLLFILLISVSLIFVLQKTKNREQVKSNKTFVFSATNFQEFDDFAKSAGVKEAYITLKNNFTQNETQAHDFAHIIGLLAYEQKGISGLNICDTAYNYGCYHGFIEGFIIKNGIEKITDIERQCQQLGPTHAPSCLHGIGHGVMINATYKLENALSDCGRLQESSQIYCQDGVFMERIVGSMIKDSSRIKLTEDNILEPCISLSRIYQKQCWRNQVTTWLSFYQQNTAKVGAKCEAIEKDFQDICFESLGLQITMIAQGDREQTVTLCRVLGKNQLSEQCLTGAMKELMFEGKPKDAAQSLCNFFQPESQSSCQALFNQLYQEYKIRFQN